MTRFPMGMIILTVVSILIYFGFAHRSLDRLRLTDRGALAFIVLMIVGSFFNITILRAPVHLAINVGGAIIPFVLALYVLIRAGTAKEWVRAIVSTAITATALYLTGRFMGYEPETTLIDPIYVFPLLAGLVAYITGRSRRGAFIGATMGVLALDVAHYFYLYLNRLPGTVRIGAAGVFDAVVIAGVAAVLIAEVIGEVRERLQGGPRTVGRPRKLVAGLKDLEATNTLAPQEEIRQAAEETVSDQKEGRERGEEESQ